MNQHTHQHTRRHTITAGDHQYTLGYDPLMATYYAHRQPAYWPPPLPVPTPTPGNTPAQDDTELGRQLREHGLAHERGMRAAYGTDWRTRARRNPTLHAAHTRHQVILWTAITAVTNTPAPASITRTDTALHAPGTPISTLLGDRYGEIRSLEELRRRLRTEHHLEIDTPTWQALDLERRDHHLETPASTNTTPAPAPAPNPEPQPAPSPTPTPPPPGTTPSAALQETRPSAARSAGTAGLPTGMRPPRPSARTIPAAAPATAVPTRRTRR